MRLKRLPLVAVKQPCDVSWDAMSGTDASRRCAQCDRAVYNLSAMTSDEAERLLTDSRGERLCITYHRGPDGHLITRDRPAQFAFGPFVSASAIAVAAAVALTISTSANAGPAPALPSAYQGSGAPATAKAPRGGLRGTVRVEVTRDLVDDAEISARDRKTGREFRSRSTKDGTYRLMLPTGRYDVKIEVPGFHTCTIEGVDVGRRLLTADVNVNIPPIGEYTYWDNCGNAKLDKLRHQK